MDEHYVHTVHFSCTDLPPKVSGGDRVSSDIRPPQLHALVGTPDGLTQEQRQLLLWWYQRKKNHCNETRKLSLSHARL